MEKPRNENHLMRAVRVDTFGPPDVVHIAQIPRPSPGSGQVLVRVHAAGVGPWDAWIRSGKSAIPQPLPLTLGSDFSGTIEEIGEGVKRLKPGDAVFGVTNPQFTGAQAEFAIASSTMIAPKPRAWNDIEAASAPVVAITAWQMLFEYTRLHREQNVLVLGAAGNVGGYVLQLAKMRGIRTIAVVSSDDADYVRSLGTDQIVNYRQTRFEDAVSNVNAVIDLVGGEMQERSLEALQRGGTLVSSVSQLSQRCETRARELGVRGIFFLTEVSTDRLLKISEMIDSRGLRPCIGEVLPLEKARLAHEMLGSRSMRKRGKIVLSVGP